MRGNWQRGFLNRVQHFFHLSAMKSTPFQTKHSLEFGQKVVFKDANGGVTMRCLFYVHEGRDNVEVGGNQSDK